METIAFETSAINPDALAELGESELTLTYAIYHVMERQLWEFANIHAAFQDPKWKARNSLVTDALSVIGAAYLSKFRDSMYTVEFRGCITDDLDECDLSHYDIENAIKKVFGTEGISCDSESSWFYVDTTEAKAQALDAWLRENYPALDFSVCDKEFGSENVDSKPPKIGSWPESLRILQNADVQATIEMPDLTPKAGKELDELLEKARSALQETGLSMEEAISLLD